MFTRSTTDSRRVLIVDASHLFYKFAYGGASRLSTTIMVNGVPTRVDTTLPTYFIKRIHRLSKFGKYPTAVCFDCQGSTKSRKAYVVKWKAEHSDSSVAQTISDYKEGRQSNDSRFYEGVNMAMNLLNDGGVCVLKAELYEADDLIKAAVDRAKEQYPDLPIDIITGDADLLPLVDDQVSVFLTSKKYTWAEEKDLELKGYIQVTPSNYQAVVEDMTKFKNLIVPYNSILLAKMLRGDSSDEIKGYKGFTPTKYKKLVNDLLEYGCDFSSLFRYDAPTTTICYRGTEEPIPEELIESTPREQKMIKYGEPPALTKICEVLSNFLDEDIIKHIRFTYNYMNLNGAYTGLPDGLNRRPAVLTADINPYNADKLQQIVSVLQINLPY